MNITSAKYFQSDGVNKSITVTIDDKELIVPLDPNNTDYAAILEWAEEDGNTIQEAD